MLNNICQKKIDEVIKYWDTRPCNIRHSDQQLGSKEYFDEVEKRKYLVEPHIPIFAEFSRWKGKKVLEIGCGIGTDAINFARAGADYTALELSKESLKLTQSRFKLFKQQGKFYLGNAEELESIVPLEKYDLIYSFGVLHHTPNPDKAVRAIAKYMSHGSVLKIMLYAKNSLKSWMIEAGLDQPEAQTGCPVANTFTRDDVEALLTKFRITKFEQDHIFPYEVDEYKNYRHVKKEWVLNMPPELFKLLEGKIGWHLLVTAELDL